MDKVDDYFYVPVVYIVLANTIKPSQYGWSLKTNTSFIFPCSVTQVCGFFGPNCQFLEDNQEQWKEPVIFGDLCNLIS